MKINRISAGLVAMLLCSSPMVLNAQNVAAPATGKLEKANVGRLTLLPGPNLLSPARTTPTMLPSPIKLDSAPALSFEPPKEQFLSGGSGTLRLIDRNVNDPLSRSGQIRTAPTVRPSPELLRFDKTFEAPPPSSRWQFIRAPKQ